MEHLIVQNFVNGQFFPTEKVLDSYDPSTGEVWAKLPDSTASDVDRAVQAATNAFPGWSSTTVRERSAIMMKIADILESRLDEFAELESHDQGKPIWLARNVDIPRAVYNFRFFATCILHQLNRSSVLDAVGAINYTVRQPVGVVGCISPWNLPLYLLTFKLAPAIASGNTVVAKPSEMTSVTAWKFAEVLNEAGLPPGVINFVFGLGMTAGDAIVRHPGVPLVSFTGGTATGAILRATAAPFCKKLSLELGGKNPAVIFDDANLEKCLQTTIRSSFTNQGEICLCTSRLFVQKGIYETFLKRFVEAAKKLKVGDPRDKDTFTGALISKEHLQKVKGYVDIAKQEGGTVLCGQEELVLPDRNKNGYFIRPTVVADVTDQSRLMVEEIFGPVVCVVPFSSEEEVIQRANAGRYGLSACVWSQDVSTVHRVSQKLHAGTVWANCWMIRDLNMPFGGMKDSGIGREGATDSMDFFTEEKTICIQL